MEQEYRWSDTRDVDAFRSPGPDNLGQWAIAAMLVSILLHILVFFVLDHVKIALGGQQSEEISTGQINIRQIEVKPYEPEASLPPEEMVTPPNESAALLEEVDLLDLLPEDQEIDISPGVVDPEYALKMSNPLAEGELDAPATENSSNYDLEADLPDFGSMDAELKPAAVGQITVDPGAVQLDDEEMTNFTEDLIKRGNNGLVENGKLDGIESLDQLLDLPPNLLLSKKTLLPSDLIFEFNRSELRESAKIGLLKLALLIDRNPNLYCWIEGHTDLVGGDEFNIQLSQKRADAVKTYLVKSMRMDPDKIFTRGYGKSAPLINEGDADAQAPNRRVEIKMRKSPPTDEPIKVTPKAKPVAEVMPEEAEAPKAILIRPKVDPEMSPEPAPPKATVIPEDPTILKATPLEAPPEVPRALPVEP
ncbi:MAG: OmpA family protein [Armatimonadetes bacterium]|nr:OmpA family protein [Akkermansiaceae bacterium]